MAKTTAKKVSKSPKAPKASAAWQSLGSLMKDHRAREGFTLAQLSDLTSIDVKDLAQFERGVKTLSLENLYSLCNYLNIPPSEFLEISHGLKK